MNSSVFLQITEGSASELDCYFLLARDLGFLPKADYLALADDLAALRKC
ncbi:MAG TPA: four helix bundle protein [Terriglobales bacterium]|nr:four helix bundle protein [Terriglobales bacterium]